MVCVTPGQVTQLSSVTRTRTWKGTPTVCGSGFPSCRTPCGARVLAGHQDLHVVIHALVLGQGQRGHERLETDCGQNGGKCSVLQDFGSKHGFHL